MESVASYLLVLGEREAIRWVLVNKQMAFPATPRKEVSALRPGDKLFLLTTRGAYHNPTRDRTRIIGTATVTSQVSRLDVSIEIAGRLFESSCRIRVESLATCLSGLEVSPLVPRIDELRGYKNWGMRLRRPLVPLTEADARYLHQELQTHLAPLDEALRSYENMIKAPNPIAS
jgi:hypothetical protein